MSDTGKTPAQQAAALAAFGSILDAVGSVYSGYLSNKVAGYNAKVAEAQANLVDSNIRSRTLMTDTNIKIRTDRSKADMRTLSGAQSAAYASSGVKLTGSPIDVIVQSQKNMELDLALTNLNDKMMTDQANITDSLTATGYRSQATIDRGMGKAAIMQGYSSATKSLLSAAVNYKKWADNENKNPLGSETIGGTTLGHELRH